MAIVKTTLVVQNFPDELSTDEIGDLVKYFGASHVRVLPKKGMIKCRVFAVFPSPALAECALGRLHQLEVFGSVLRAEYAKTEQRGSFPKLGDIPQPAKVENVATTGDAVKPSKKSKLQSSINEFHKSLQATSEKFGIKYPLSPHFVYHYPPPNRNIIANIIHSLISVPKFYTQVIHLMNKMNLPPPFGPITQAPPIIEDGILERELQAGQHIVSDDVNVEEEMESETESELESENEGDNVKTSEFPVKRAARTTKKSNKKRLLSRIRNKTVKSNDQEIVVNKVVKADEVFDVSGGQQSKKIELKIAPSLSDQSVSQVEEQTDSAVGGFGVFAPTAKTTEEDEEPEKDVEYSSEFITSSDLKANRIPKDDFKRLPVFKNYQAGTPTTRLYIKNVAKGVEEKDLYFIYGRYVNMGNEDEKNMFDIRLMTEGRMKGQAFVTLPTPQKAERALNETNGFILKDRPLVVQFARSAKAKDSK